jgi:hypothetical protein
MKRAIIVPIAALALVVGGVAWASIPDGSGVIHGCYKLGNPAKGAVLVIDSDAGESCPAGTAPLNWNQTGPQGPSGPAGPSGPISGYQILTEHVNIEPSAPGTYLPQGTSMGAPTGKVILSGGYYAESGGGQEPPLVAYSFVDPGQGPYPGSVHVWGFICHRLNPCPIDKYIVVADAASP